VIHFLNNFKNDQTEKLKMYNFNVPAGNASNCKDKAISQQNEIFQNYDLNAVWFSEEACKGVIDRVEEVGNEDFLIGYQLEAEDLKKEHGGGGFVTPSPEACETECYVRKDVCAAWTFIPDVKGTKKAFSKLNGPQPHHFFES
jgi:hypothetical protein